MKRCISLTFGILITAAVAACNASNATSEVPLAIQPTKTALILPTSTKPFIPTVDPLTPSAIAQYFHTLEATTITPEATTAPNYKECSQWNELTADQNWALCDSRAEPIILVNKSNQTWQFSYKTYYKTEAAHLCTHLLFTTSDENYLYFSLGEGCELIEPAFMALVGVFRMNLHNGEVKEILKASYDFDSYSGHYYTASISPTGRRLVYITDQDQPLKLHLLDLQTGEEQFFLIDSKYTFGGAYTWSVDGTKLVFMLESEANYDHFISMVFFDLSEDNSMVTFIKDQEFNWIAATIDISNVGVKISPVFGEPLFYNIDTGILGPLNK